MTKFLSIVTLGVIAVFGSGCISTSNAWSVTGSDDKGDYLTVINKTTYFLYMPISSRNVVVRCHKADDSKCETMNLWSPEGWRIF